MLSANRLLWVFVPALALFVSRTALAQEDAPTWTNDRTTPGRDELIAVDATGEAQWPYGRESVLDNGNAFPDAEARIDLRTAYADSTPTEIWLRAYTVGAPPATSLEVVFFIDSDHQTSTGGSAAASVIDEDLDSDPTDGGYEYALLVPADPAGSAVLYEWLPLSSVWTRADDQPALTKTSGTALDAIRNGRDPRGYVQVRAPLESVALTEVCDAHLFVRGLVDEAGLEPGDLALGEASECVPPDANNNDVSDVEEDTGPNGDITRDPGTGQDDDDDTGRGGPFGNDGAAGGSDDITIADDEEVQGGACTCGLVRRTGSPYAALGVIGLGLAWILRRARRPSEPSTSLS